uniref:Uncharacterized protein n=1 Tax=Strombidium inclinatum TaxID=197538 RepID=A0A7S3IJD9_9SPIT|mmetsp:Transcript_22414/g.34671  ORF Transcript_22414/g.34671 Transcript_22414/m.34671 type:complete len:114 (+) Transcript_22414:14-355(+)
MFAGVNRTTAPTYHVNEDALRLRPYNQALNDFTASLCKEIGQEGQDNCLFETRTAFDCVLRGRVTKGGDIADNIGHCKHHIANMKSHVSRSDFHNRLLDSKLDEVESMSKSFV